MNDYLYRSLNKIVMTHKLIIVIFPFCCATVFCCTSSPTPQHINLTDLYPCKINEQQQVERVEILSVNSDKLRVCGRLSSDYTVTAIQASWFYNNRFLHNETLRVEHTFISEFVPTTKPSPVGTYRIIITAGKKEIGNITFKVDYP